MHRRVTVPVRGSASPHIPHARHLPPYSTPCCCVVRCAFRERVKVLLGMEENTIIEYKLHKDSIRDKSTYKNTESFVFQVGNQCMCVHVWRAG